MTLDTIFNALPVLGPLARAVPAVKSLLDDAIGALHPTDQPAAKAELARLIDENDAGHTRLQDKLARASQR